MRDLNMLIEAYRSEVRAQELEFEDLTRELVVANPLDQIATMKARAFAEGRREGFQRALEDLVVLKGRMER